MTATSLRLMAILAHPDDESLGNGGTLARYAAERVEVTLVTATRGQRGWFGDPAANPGLNALGELREAELREAAAELGIREVILLDYVDGDLDQADAERVTCELVNHIRRVSPQVVLTFGLDGAYGHPDHMAISQLTTRAIVHAADARYGHGCTTRSPHSVSKLYHLALTAAKARVYQAAFGDISMEIDGAQRMPVVVPDWLIGARIEAGEHWRTAFRAVTHHRSQLPNYAHLVAMSETSQRELWATNEYVRVFSTVNSGPEVEHDLFAGLRESVGILSEVA
jgi:LmbE family N-acetylglucosaminyl deacetylase